MVRIIRNAPERELMNMHEMFLDPEKIQGLKVLCFGVFGLDH